MIKLISFSSLFLVLISCSTSLDEAVKEVSESKTELNNVVSNKVLSFDVSGMECEMACGGSIRKGLIETGAVSRVQFVDFEMGAESNSTKVYFDDSKISEDKIKAIVSSLNENQFKVSNSKLDDFIDGSVVEGGKKESDNIQKSSTDISSNLIELPNLLDLVRSLILN